jgi:hypothetical protein
MPGASSLIHRDGQQPAKTGNSACRNPFRIAVIRMMFDEASGK